MVDIKCRHCDFWSEGGGYGYSVKEGTCRARPPVIVHERIGSSGDIQIFENVTRWPQTNNDEWCGAFEHTDDGQDRRNRQGPRAD